MWKEVKGNETDKVKMAKAERKNLEN